MSALESGEAKTYKALDTLEALVSHDESDVSTWLPLEHDLQLTYGREAMAFSPWIAELRAAVDEWSRRKTGGAAGSAETMTARKKDHGE